MSAHPPTALIQSTTKGIAFFVLFSLTAPAIDVFAKLAAAEIPAAEITLARFLVQTVILAPIVFWRGAFYPISRRDLAQHAARGVLMAIATVFFFAALKHMPIADAISIFFVEPLILTLLGGLILGERIGWRRIAACVVGFLGALIVIRPSFDDLGWVAALPLGTAVTFALYLILTRTMAQRTDPFAMQAWSGFFGFLFIAVVLAAFQGTGDPTFDPVWPSAAAAPLLLGVGVVATVTHLFVVYAFRNAPTSTLAPLQYLEIVAATTWGYFIFDDFPEPIKWLGISIIIGSGLFVFARERALERRGET